MTILLLAGNSFAQGPPFSQRQPIDVCRELAGKQNEQISILNQRIAGLQEQLANREAEIQAWEARSSGKITKKEWAVMVLTVVAAVGTVVGR